MRVLVATSESMGIEAIDFDVDDKIEDGELVIAERCIECDPDGYMFRGVESQAATSCARVVERPDLNIETCVDILMATYVDAMHIDANMPAPLLERVEKLLAVEIQRLLTVADELPVGTLVRRNKDAFYIKHDDITSLQTAADAPADA